MLFAAYYYYCLPLLIRYYFSLRLFFIFFIDTAAIAADAIAIRYCRCRCAFATPLMRGRLLLLPLLLACFDVAAWLLLISPLCCRLSLPCPPYTPF